MPPRKEDGKLSPLITPDPHYIPGYQGHVPGFTFHFGDTFGHTSNKLLTDPCIPGSGNLVQPLNFNVGRSDPAIGPLVRSSGCNFPRLTTNMVPGYSGRIPAYDNVFGLSYARGTEKAVRDFECNQFKARQQRQRVNSLAGMDTCNSNKPSYNTNCPVPLWSRNNQGFRSAGGGSYAGPYDRQAPFQFVESPYFMGNDDPRKFFMSGYTGFVPNTQPVIGNVFPITTNKGLRKFTDEQCRIRQNFCKPVVVSTKSRDYDPPNAQLQDCSQEPLRTMNIPDLGAQFDPSLMVGCGPHALSQHNPNEDFLLNKAKVSPAIMNQVPALGQDRLRRKMQIFKKKDPHPIYRIQEGLLPTYGGHVPNQQFRFGGTFGRETVNARALQAVVVRRS